ncbi:nucleotide sugar dehydrogenase [Halobacillus litoralis]|uniref:nucleotide sugar dehydrogenase n=1 Tax=Halobacillus litoralis TaxID=45668 RepID=UPI001CD62C1F|nr:nucleotide sugar dehydrogenase [Halobacillus litoralis]MCA0970449.1 nucleotide sugar dehydrogenase [Halobacillus litoralis]
MNEKPSQHTPVVAVVGLGYVGLPLAMLFSKRNIDVIGLDINEDRITQLKNKKSYLPDIQDEEIKLNIERGIFKPTSKYTDLTSADVIIICVPTPLTDYHTPDLSYLQSVASSLSSHLRKGQLVILESSTYPGTTEEVLQPHLEKKSKLKVGEDFFLAYSPERIDPGNKQFTEIEKVPKVVSGVSEACKEKIIQLYSLIFDHVVAVSSPKAAEFTKLLENSFRLINIAFINELARVADHLHIDIWETIEAANTKPYGFTPFYPGIGAGGHCIPVDPLYLNWKAQQVGSDSEFINLADRINRLSADYAVAQIQKALDETENPRVLLVGVAYKKDLDDIREAPSLTIIDSLMKKGIDVTYHDPLVPKLKVENKWINSVELSEENLKRTDCVVLLTDHSNLPIQRILDSSSLVYDTKNMTKDMTGKARIIRLGGGGS